METMLHRNAHRGNEQYGEQAPYYDGRGPYQRENYWRFKKQEKEAQEKQLYEDLTKPTRGYSDPPISDIESTMNQLQIMT